MLFGSQCVLQERANVKFVTQLNKILQSFLVWMVTTQYAAHFFDVWAILKYIPDVTISD